MIEFTETKVKEEGTATFKVMFYDEDDNLVVPDSITWTLSDDKRNVINGRLNVAVIVPASTIYVQISGNDNVREGYGIKRRLLVKWIYDSSYGNDLPQYEEIWFTLEDLVMVS